MATLLPNGEQVFLSQNGTPLEAGLVYMYVPNTTTFKDTWQDSGQLILNDNPITLDAAGRAVIYGSGIYRQVVHDSAGNLQWDELTADTAVGGLSWGGTSTGTPNAQVIAASSFTQGDGQQISFLVGVGLTNTSALTVAPGGGTGIAVLKDTPTGPTALTGGEAVAGNAVTLLYDSARGAFHMVQNDTMIPAGAVQAYAMTAVPAGWLECDGSSLLRASYPALFTAIGTTFGTADGTHFNIPDLRGYFVRGWAHAGSVDSGRVFGSTQTSANLQHTHTATFVGDALTGHAHTTQVGSNDASQGIAADGGTPVTANPSTTSVSAGTPTGTISVANSGGTEARPVNVALMYAIKY